MNRQPVKGAKHVSGDLSTGRLFLTRRDGSSVRCGVVIVQATLTDNSDSTYDLTFDGS